MSKATPIKRPPEGLLEQPINVLNDRLAQAHATVDLPYMTKRLSLLGSYPTGRSGG